MIKHKDNVEALESNTEANQDTWRPRCRLCNLIVDEVRDQIDRGAVTYLQICKWCVRNTPFMVKCKSCSRLVPDTHADRHCVCVGCFLKDL